MRPLTRLQLISTLTVIATGACRHDANTREAQPRAQEPMETPPSAPAASRPASPTIEAMHDTQKIDGHDITTFEAYFDIDRFAAGKRFQGSWLITDSGRPLIASYRPIEEHYDKVGKRVIVEGYHYSNPPHVQQIMAPHFKIISMKLAPGQIPATSDAGQLPASPQLANMQALEAHLNRWGQVHATLTKIESLDWSYDLTFSVDGGEVKLLLSKSRLARELPKELSPLDDKIGQKFTVVGRVVTNAEETNSPRLLDSNQPIEAPQDKEASTPHIILGGSAWMCSGHVEACGARR